MTDRQAFLAALCENPDDDQVRLVFADWLEEQGVSESDRDHSKFIRLQCELERFERWSPDRMDLEERATDLLSKHRQEWQAAVPEWARCIEERWDGPRFRRGFLDRVHGTPEQFADSAATLFTAAPVREARLGWGRDGGSRLAQAPALAHLRRLHLVFIDNKVDIPLLVSSPFLTNLRELAIDYLAPIAGTRVAVPAPILRDEDAAALATCAALANLTELDLGTNWIGPDGVSALSQSPFLLKLERLDLRHNPLRDEGIARLAQSSLPDRLTHLGLTRTDITEEGLRVLAERRPGRLRSLTLGNNEVAIEPTGIRSLGQCESMATLQELNLDSWELTPEHIHELAQSPYLGGLRDLQLISTTFDDDMAKELAASPYLRNIRFLDLQNNRLGSEGLVALARSSVLNSVTHFCLSNNRLIGDQGVSALADMPCMPEMRSLWLPITGIRAAGTRALAQSPYFGALRDLDLQSNPIGDEGARALCESPYLGKIRRLFLYDCKISADMAKELRSRFGAALRI